MNSADDRTQRELVEEYVADRVEGVMAAEGISPGPRDREDAQRGLRVDFVYPEAEPTPIALEITSIVEPIDRAAPEEADALSRRLSRTAEAERLGSWLVMVQSSRSFRRLEPEIAKVIRDSQPVRQALLDTDGQIRPNHYTAQELMALPSDAARSRFIAEHQRLKDLGLEEVKPIRGSREHCVGVMPFRGAWDIGSFADMLRVAIEENAVKLGEAVGFEHHLAVLVDRFDVSTSPELTPPPMLPSEIDAVWVVHRWQGDMGRKTTWVARRGSSRWRVHGT